MKAESNGRDHIGENEGSHALRLQSLSFRLQLEIILEQPIVRTDQCSGKHAVQTNNGQCKM
jgi:hypothetical protein